MKVKITKSELLNLKRKEKFVHKGKDLLKRKMTVLVTEVTRMISALEKSRKEFDEIYKEANKAVGLAIAYEGIGSLKSVGEVSSSDIDVELTPRNVMGVSIPEVTFNIGKENKVASPFTVSFRVYKVKKKYEMVIQKALSFVEAEISMKKLLKEISATKRKVNALEFRVLPEIGKLIDEMEFHLNEIRREDFVRLKKIISK